MIRLRPSLSDLIAIRTNNQVKVTKNFSNDKGKPITKNAWGNFYKLKNLIAYPIANKNEQEEGHPESINYYMESKKKLTRKKTLSVIQNIPENNPNLIEIIHSLNFQESDIEFYEETKINENEIDPKETHAFTEEMINFIGFIFYRMFLLKKNKVYYLIFEFLTFYLSIGGRYQH